MIKKSIKRIVFASVIIAVNFAMKFLLLYLPNVKPTTSLIILSSMYLGIISGTYIVAGIVFISGMLFGFGTFVPFQFAAWEIIAIVAFIFKDFLKKHKIIFVIYAMISGFFFGFVSSLDMLILYGRGAFITYYLNGLSFDLLHAIGNAVFSAILFVVFEHLHKQKMFRDFI